MRSLLQAVRARVARWLGPPPPVSETDLAAQVFDPAYYLSNQPDVAAAGIDPFAHFMEFGWRENRDPAPGFSLAAYGAAYPQVAEQSLNPLIHYVTHGRPPILPPEPPLGFRHAIIETLPPLADRVAAATAGAVEATPPAALAEALARAPDGLRRVHITFSQDNFNANLGGLQLSVGREAARLAELGRDHLHLYPAKPWPVVRTKADPSLLGVALNGEPVGMFAPAAIAAALAEVGPGESRSFAIHSLLGHSADETADILAAAGLSAGAFWLHDFASLCAGFHLLRNDVADCGAPPPGSAACGVCLYGPGRERHVSEHARLFERLSLTVVAPSAVTLELWRASTTLPAAATQVLPHATLVPRGPAPLPPAGRPFRLAYAGLATPHKGWPVFRALTRRFVGDPRYEFVHLGARPADDAAVRFEAVRATPDRPAAMREALEAIQADAVLLWPLCRETFSIVAYEAVAAGAALITSPDSGNVAAFVADGGHGRVLRDEAALVAAMSDGSILELGRAQRRPMLYDLAFSALTLDLPAAANPPAPNVTGR